MSRRVLAFDFGGTLAEDRAIPSALQTALKRLRAMGCVLFLVTGRRFADVKLGALQDLFAGIVWENGAVLHHTATDGIFLPFGRLDAGLAAALEASGVPLRRGRATVFTRRLYEASVWRVLNDWCGDAVIVRDKEAVGVLPPGTAKGAGLERLLELCDLSPHNLVSFGDGESDLSLLQLAEIGVAVADASPCLKEVAELVAGRPGPAGVLQALKTYWLQEGVPDTPLLQGKKRAIPLGKDEADHSVALPAVALTDQNMGLFGDSSSGKSWIAGLLAEGMHHRGYQILLIDPEGDFRRMRALPRMVALEGDAESLPSPASVAMLLETTAVSAVLDLCLYPVAQRDRYVADLLRALRTLKETKFHPHWVVLEEAQHFLPPCGNAVSTALSPMLPGGGWAFVSYRPDRLDRAVLETLDRCILTRLSQPEAIQAVGQVFERVADVSLPDVPQRHALLCDQRLVRLRPNSRRVPHIRHLYKYFDTPLPAHKRFRFHNERGSLGLEAASLYEFMQHLRNLPLESLVYHQNRGDFTAWADGALGDRTLGNHLRKLGRRSLQGETLRQALLQRVETHYEELQALR